MDIWAVRLSPDPLAVVERRTSVLPADPEVRETVSQEESDDKVQLVDADRTAVALPPAAFRMAASVEERVSSHSPSKTVTWQVALFSPDVAVMVALPLFIVVTLPSSTVATPVSELLHTTVLSEAFSGFMEATSVSVLPGNSVNSVLSRLTDVTSMMVGSGTGSGVFPQEKRNKPAKAGMSMRRRFMKWSFLIFCRQFPFLFRRRGLQATNIQVNYLRTVICKYMEKRRKTR